MTGAYVRVKRAGKWENVEIEHCTDQEREDMDMFDEKSVRWINMLCNKLVEVEKLLDSLVDEGILKVEPHEKGKDS